MGEPILQILNPCIARFVYEMVKLMAKVYFSVLICSTFKSCGGYENITHLKQQ